MLRILPGSMSMWRVFSSFCLLLAFVIGFPEWAQSQEHARDLSTQALDECDKGRREVERSVRLRHFKKAEDLAEQAVSLDNHLPNAHFALFCAVGEQMRIDGPSFASMFGFRRMMNALDRTLELDPNHLDALSSKGTFLIRLPMFLGGDADKGEAMLQEVLEREPRSINARLVLAEIYADRGKRQQAIRLATKAVEIAEEEHRADLLPKAKETLSQILQR